ncbi:hypothetical protein ACFVT9_25445 [Kitasatospora cineracea]|uniref:hypothetical protein n=1 Tax=Kitasatospora cineracea TaxID=88074 RepID=UPI0036DD8AD0
MPHPALALGTAALTATGSAWHLPALLDLLGLRAGADRPRAARLAATACLLWWCAPAAAALLLTTPLPWPVPLGALLTGALSGGVLHCSAAAARRADQREQARAWNVLHSGRPYTLPADPPPTTHRTTPPTPAAARLTAALVLPAATAATALLTGHPGPGPTSSAVLTVTASIGLCLLIPLLSLHHPRPH